MNSLFVIHPYKHFGQWVFDDAAKGLDKEALVAGIDTMLDIWAKKLDTKELVVVFSDNFFPTMNFQLDFVRADVVGNWYESKALGFQGWLCPALFKYFPIAPQKICAQIKKQ